MLMNKLRNLFFFLILLPVAAAAQNYNPYANHNIETCSGKVTCGACFGTGNCYGYICMSCSGTGLINCPSCAGYRMGQQMAKKMEQQRWNNAYNTLEDGLSSLRQKAYNSALKYLKRSAELGNGQAMAYVGNMYELGLGVEANTQTAKLWYNKGSNKNNNLSLSNLNRIKKYGFWRATVSNRQNYIQNLNDIWNLAGAISQQTINNMDWGTSSSSGRSNSSTYTTCRVCGGTKKCTSCHGKGGEWRNTGYYTGSGNNSWINCPSCKGSRRCFNCNGTGKQ